MIPLILSCFAVCIAAQEINDDVCQSTRTAYVAHPYSCTKYYQCQNYKPVAKVCSAGRQFNTKAKRCEKATEVCAFNPFNFGSCKKIMCYISFMEGFKPTEFDARQCSHVLTYDHLLNLDPENNAEPNEITIREIMDWKKDNPNLKILLSLRRGSAGFTFKSKTSLKIFIENEIKILRKYDFDGINYFWVWPYTKHKELLTDLLKTSMELFEIEAKNSNRPRLIISNWVDGDLARVPAYEIDQIDKYVDFTLLCVVDFWGFWYGVTGSTAPFVKVEGTVNFFLNAGMSPEKMIVLLPSHYRSFKLTDPNKHGLGAPTSGYGVSPIDGTQGYTYIHVCKLEKLEGVVIVNDKRWNSYLYKDDFWLSYDNEQDLEAKVNLTVSKNLGGILLYALNYDDQLGTECGKGKFSWTKSVLKMCQKIS